MEKTTRLYFTRHTFPLLLVLLLLKCEAKSHGSPETTQGQCVAVEATSFIELVDKSRAFVDKTLFIKDFLEAKFAPHSKDNRPTEVIRVSYPRKWGKTMNMKMIEDFLQMEVDEAGNQVSPKDTAAYKLFALGKTPSGNDVQLNIASHRDIIDEYLAQHSAIYVSFKNVTGSTYGEIVMGMKRTVARTFKNHAYMAKVFYNVLKNESADGEVKAKARENLETFQAILSLTAKDFDAPKSCRFLAGVLRDHFNKGVYLLLDDHDQPYLTLLTQNATNLSDFKQTQEYLGNFISDSLSFCPNCEKSLMNGIVSVPHIVGDDRQTADLHLTEFTVLGNKFANHYGFSQDEVSVLCEKCGINPKLAEDALRWYKGFTTNKARYVDVYNPFDVSMFAYTWKISNYWVMSGAVAFAPGIFKYTVVESFVLSLLNKETVVIESDDLGCSATQVEKLATALNPSTSALSSPLPIKYKSSIFYKFLLMTGYLTLNRSSESFGTVHVRIPNEEIATEVGSLMVQHYIDTYSVSYVVLNQLADELKRLLKSKDTGDFKKSLDTFFSAFPEFADKMGEDTDVINSAFNMFTLVMKGIYHFNAEVYLLKEGDKSSGNPNSRPNVVLYFQNMKLVIILQLTFNLSAEKALALAEEYLKFFDHRIIKVVGLMGINVFPNRTVGVKEFWGEKKE